LFNERNFLILNHWKFPDDDFMMFAKVSAGTPEASLIWVGK
jgi:hypothetical protein